MRFLSTSPDEPGFLAFGQEAYGVIAIGQVATGVIAVGQLARGVVAVGQLAVGLFVVSQLGFGLFAGVGMIGLFGRGWPFSLVPKLDRPRELPPTTSLDDLRVGYGDGWIAGSLAIDEGVPGLVVGGRRAADVKLSCRLVRRAEAEFDRYPSPEVVAHVRRNGDVLVCDRLLHVPVPTTARRSFWPLFWLRMAFLVALAVIWVFALLPPLTALFS